MQDIKTKHCAIVKEEERYFIIDLYSYDTRQLTNEEIGPQYIKPLKPYELRNNDKIFIGSHQIIFRDEPDIKIQKPSFFVPETQELSQIETKFKIDPAEHVEIPETQDFCTPDIIDGLDDTCDNSDKFKNDILLVKTQPLLNKVPLTTRAKSIKLAQIKPKTVPLSVFDTQTQKMTKTLPAKQWIKTEPAKMGLKRRAERKSGKNSKQPKLNSVLLSEGEESESDNDCSRTSVLATLTVRRVSQNDDDSLNISMNDEFDIPSAEFDSQFLAQLNGSNDENNSNNNSAELVTEPLITNDVQSAKKTSPQKSPTPRRRKVKLFKYSYSDDDD